jgi:hypothetical protein
MKPTPVCAACIAATHMGAGPDFPHVLVGPAACKAADHDTRPDHETPCLVCEKTPTVPITGMCGPCTFGKADTVGKNW